MADGDNLNRFLWAFTVYGKTKSAELSSKMNYFRLDGRLTKSFFFVSDLVNPL